MLVESIILAILVSLIMGGSIKNIGDINFEKVYLPYTAVILEFCSGLILQNNFFNLRTIIYDYTLIIELIVYVLLFVFIYINSEKSGFKIVMFGVLLNFIVIMANKGFMPVDISMAKEFNFQTTLFELKNNLVFAHKIITENTKLIFLSDWIEVKPPYLFPSTFSLGDLMIDIGIFWFIFNKMGAFKKLKNNI